MLPLKDTVPSRTFPAINWLLIGLNMLMFIGELSAEARGQLEALVQVFGVVPARFLHYPNIQEIGTLFTSMFLHGGWLHLISNMLALYIFGDNVEDRMGHVKYLVFYLLCGAAAGMTHIFFNQDSTMPSIGASGAIAGVMGAYFLLFPQARVITLIPVFFLPFIVEIPAVVFIGFWFLSQLFSGTLEIVHGVYGMEAGEHGGIAWWAHVGGFVAGALLVWVFATRPKKVRRRYPDEYYPW